MRGEDADSPALCRALPTFSPRASPAPMSNMPPRMRSLFIVLRTILVTAQPCQSIGKLLHAAKGVKESTGLVALPPVRRSPAARRIRRAGGFLAVLCIRKGGSRHAHARVGFRVGAGG